MNNSILLYANGNSENHGCEAIVRSTCQIIRSITLRTDIVFTSFAKTLDDYYLDGLCNCIEIGNSIRRVDLYRAYLKYKLFNDSVALDVYPYNELIRSIPKHSIAVSLGGDNYCYPGQARFYRLNKNIRGDIRKNIFWACS